MARRLGNTDVECWDDGESWGFHSDFVWGADFQAYDLWLGYCLRTPERSKVPSYSTAEGCKSRNDFCGVAVNWKDLGQYRPWPNRGTVQTVA